MLKWDLVQHIGALGPTWYVRKLLEDSTWATLWRKSYPSKERWALSKKVEGTVMAVTEK